jgi:protein-disulfide isomerase
VGIPRNRETWVLAVAALGASAAGWAQSQANIQPPQTGTEVASLQRRVSDLEREQQALIEEMDELKKAIAPRNSTPAQSAPSTLRIDPTDFRGDASARMAIVEYSDFECPYCGLYEREDSPEVLKNFVKTGAVKLFFRDLPLPFHRHAMQAARAAHCAGDQGKYWEMHDSLFANQRDLSDAALRERAKTLGLDTDKFNEWLSSDKYTEDIRKSISDAEKLGVTGTPTFFIGTISADGNEVTIKKRIAGTRPYEVFKSALDEVIASEN